MATNPASGRNRQRRVGEGHLGPTRDSVNGFFAVIFQKLEISRNSAIPDQSQACLLGLLSAILWGQRSLTCRDSPQKRMIPASNFPHGDSRNESIHHPNDSRTPSAPCALWFERRRLCPTAYRLMEPLIRSRKIRSQQIRSRQIRARRLLPRPERGVQQRGRGDIPRGRGDISRRGAVGSWWRGCWWRRPGFRRDGG